MRRQRHTEVADELLGVVVDQTTLLDGLFDSREVGVREDHVSGKFRNVCAATHCNTNVGLLESGGIVDTITSL